ncbi:unnamed protein product [Effrenium voratum]|uniref:Uncharacterized protein n=1 Tax=Effrenium voratum TaxID=2562239 RepID=A0AA36HPL7_9DINO|nr:unnamed protein product [Effrenium voratum]
MRIPGRELKRTRLCRNQARARWARWPGIASGSFASDRAANTKRYPKKQIQKPSKTPQIVQAALPLCLFVRRGHVSCSDGAWSILATLNEGVATSITLLLLTNATMQILFSVIATQDFLGAEFSEQVWRSA